MDHNELSCTYNLTNLHSYIGTPSLQLYIGSCRINKWKKCGQGSRKEQQPGEKEHWPRNSKMGLKGRKMPEWQLNPVLRVCSLISWLSRTLQCTINVTTMVDDFHWIVCYYVTRVQRYVLFRISNVISHQHVGKWQMDEFSRSNCSCKKSNSIASNRHWVKVIFGAGGDGGA